MKKYFAGEFVTYHEYGKTKVGIVVEVDHFDNETYVVLSDYYSDSNIMHHTIIKEDVIINVVNLKAVTTMLQVL